MSNVNFEAPAEETGGCWCGKDVGHVGACPNADCDCTVCEHANCAEHPCGEAFDGFTAEERDWINEIAFAALTDAKLFEIMAERLDLADGLLQSLRDKLIAARGVVDSFDGLREIGIDPSQPLTFAEQGDYDVTSH